MAPQDAETNADRTAEMVSKGALIASVVRAQTAGFAVERYGVELERIDNPDARRSAFEAATALRINWLERRVAELER